MILETLLEMDLHLRFRFEIDNTTDNNVSKPNTNQPQRRKPSRISWPTVIRYRVDPTRQTTSSLCFRAPYIYIKIRIYSRAFARKILRRSARAHARREWLPKVGFWCVKHKTYTKPLFERELVGRLLRQRMPRPCPAAWNPSGRKPS